MSLSIAREKLNYSQEQLDELSRQIRVGDLTPVLKIYEEDIKSPLKSIVAGSLLRSVFIQVQKVKVGGLPRCCFQNDLNPHTGGRGSSSFWHRQVVEVPRIDLRLRRCGSGIRSSLFHRKLPQIVAIYEQR